MSRPCGLRVAWAAVLALAAGCQNYNFNPVGHCIMQPGSQTFTLSNVSTADVLFVIDDSGSMAGEQDKLASNFSSFINNLNATNLGRAQTGLRPIDFHIAVTTTSVFYNFAPDATTWTCKASCGSSGQVCCNAAGTAPVLGPRRCAGDAQCTSLGANVRCRTTCRFTYQSPAYGPYDLLGESYCCDQTTNTAPPADPISCSVVGQPCGTFEHHYDFLSCQAGVATDGTLYPRGNFVGASTNPRVLHFDKSLYPNPPSSTATNRQGFTSAELVDFFAGNPVGTNANVKVGTCGSGEEQGLAAARLALEKALAGQQTDTYSMAAGKVQATSTAEWPHANSKLVLVFIGDEDDCSSPDVDPSAAIAILATNPLGTSDVAGADACTRNDGGKEYDVASRFVSYFMGLGRPVGAAFIESFIGSASNSVCSYPNCTAAKCCQPDCPTNGTCGTTGYSTYCGGQAPGTRFAQAASAFATAGADVVMGSVCDPNFGTLLDEIANILKLPSGLVLPTVPAEADITVLRIANSEGVTVRDCGRPALPPLTATQANAQGYQWWFTATDDPPDPQPSAVSKYVHINPTGGCIASPGETYSAEYIGMMPPAGCHSDADCRTALGGSTDSWTCYAGMVGNQCASVTTNVGTCLCGALSRICPNGRL